VTLPFEVPAGLTLPQPLLQQVLTAYAEPQRAYHSTRHLVEVLAQWAQVEREGAWQHPRETFLGLLFHDAVYVPGAADNEEASAALALEACAQWLPGAGIDAPYVAHLVRLTARHGHLAPSDVSAEEALLLDCDMAVLGGAREAYDAYECGVAQEYAALPPELYAAGRRRFLEGLLAREHLYLSPRFRERFEHRARENLQRALGAFETGVRPGP
jgi:predicted metal-dependent HD superfamily phosphohydrolase